MSLTRDDLVDIKQLMEATVNGAITELKVDLDKNFAQIDQRFEQIDQRFERIDQQLDTFGENQNEILNAVGTDLNDTAKTLVDHDIRITKLEKAAL
ncbi:MAG: hypothetical protein ABI397_01345 [Candidatus Saccharimonas sp.]